MIKWKSVQVKVDSIDPTPKNYKIASELGKERLQMSLKKFGLAGNVVLNYGTKGRWVLIDGNSRLAEAKAAKEKMIWASIPSKPLTPKEFKEMSAMFDYAKAGEVDIEAIEGDLGTTKDFYNSWGLNVPFHLLDKMGAKAVKETLERSEPVKKSEVVKEIMKSDVNVIQLLMTEKQAKEFKWLEERLAKKFKVSSTLEVVFKAMKKSI